MKEGEKSGFDPGSHFSDTLGNVPENEKVRSVIQCF